ncbi:MAG: iron-sulfur cluster assembly scaffold protein [Cytophagales bacterium]|nr:iron-sulfur cluster assembly scaffold protein [Cytophagales bacterium]
MYSTKVKDHFMHPRNVGTIDNPSAVGEVGNPVCGDIMRMYLLIDDTTKIITDCKFQTFGCGAAIATSSMATDLIKGKTIYEAVKITNNAVLEALDDLPPHKKHCSVLAEEAIHAALKDYSQRTGVDIPGLKDITHEGSSHCDIQ